MNHSSALQAIKNNLMDKKRANLIHLVISGAHSYGFPSKDSDYDYRGTYIVDTKDILRYDYGRYDEFWRDDKTYKSQGWDFDIFELKKTINLLLKSNCNVVEHLYMEPIFINDDIEELKNIMDNNFSRTGIFDSYEGMAKQNYKKFIEKVKRPSVKKYLYVFRGLLAGIYALDGNGIEPNIQTLVDHFGGNEEIQECIDLKKDDQEWTEIDNCDKYKKLIEKLFEDIKDAEKRSKLPEFVTDTTKSNINDFLVKTRVKYLNNLQ